MLLPMKDFIIVEPTFAQLKFPPKNEILNRKFSNLPPEDLQFDDDNMNVFVQHHMSQSIIESWSRCY